MALYFVTGNPGKLLEAQRALGRFGVEVRGAKADFDEPRSDDLAQIARAKVRQAAAQKVPAPFFVQDAEFFIDALRGFPGTEENFVLRRIVVADSAKLTTGERIPTPSPHFQPRRQPPSRTGRYMGSHSTPPCAPAARWTSWGRMTASAMIPAEISALTVMPTPRLT